MSILTDTLQNTIMVDGVSMEIDTSFNHFIDVVQSMLYGDEERLYNAVCKITLGDESHDADSVAEAIINYIQATNEKNKKASKGKNKKRDYDFDIDATAIFSDFLQYYNIDLTVEKIPWKKFQYLFADLPSDGAFNKRVKLRTITKKQAEAQGYKYSDILPIKRELRLPKTLQEIEAEKQFERELYESN